MKAYLLRRRKLGKTSCKGIEEVSKTGIVSVLNTDENFPENAELCIRWGCTSNVPQKNILYQIRR